MMWSGGSGGWWLLAIPLMLICMFVMMRMMGHRHGAHGAHPGEPPAPRSGGPERILAERLARGEIDIEEYERRRAALRSSSKLGRT
jgi:putative membrane protein